MLTLGLVLLLVGCVVAALLERTVGVILAVVGLVLVVIGLLAGVDAHDAVVVLGRRWT